MRQSGYTINSSQKNALREWVTETSGNDHRQVETIEDLQMEDCNKGRCQCSSKLPNPSNLKGFRVYPRDLVSALMKNLILSKLQTFSKACFKESVAVHLVKSK
jgi:hypothetical protein